MDIANILIEIRGPLQSSNNSIAHSLDSPEANRPGSPEPSRLIQAVYFSRSFTPTYYIFFAGLVLVASFRYFRRRQNGVRAVRQRNIAEKSSPPSSSSASSTLVGEDITASNNDTTTEQTYLLRQGIRSRSTPSTISRLRARTNAFLTYQPRPIPSLTAPSNQLPANKISLLVIAYFGVNLFYLLYGIQFFLAMTFAFAHRAGLLFVVNLPILYLLGAKNNQPLKWLTGWSYEKLNIFHRRLGEWMIVLGVLHCIGMFVTWYTIIRPAGDVYDLSWFLSQRIIVLGLLALTSFLVIWFTSTGRFREKSYELFLASHIVLQTAALILLFFHHEQGRPYCGAALGIWVLDRCASRFWLSTRKFVATLEIAKDEKTVLLYCDIALDRSKRGNIRSGWKVGQHVFLSVPGIAWQHAFQAHPFTIASPAPPAGLDGTVWPMQLIVRAMDGFSKELLEHAKHHQHVEIYLDGPYGDAEIAHDVLKAKRVCLIAGGSGITVTYPIAWLLWTKGKDVPILSTRTVYDNGRKRKTEVQLRSSQFEEEASHIWIRQDPAHGSWITMFPDDYTRPWDASETSHCSNGVNVVSRTFDTRHGGHSSRPHVATEMRMWLENTKSICDQRPSVCVVVSGPEGLVRDVRNCVSELIKEGHHIDLHVEKFGW